jgi:hypothetical protein
MQIGDRKDNVAREIKPKAGSGSSNKSSSECTWVRI